MNISFDTQQMQTVVSGSRREPGDGGLSFLDKLKESLSSDNVRASKQSKDARKADSASGGDVVTRQNIQEQKESVASDDETGEKIVGREQTKETESVKDSKSERDVSKNKKSSKDFKNISTKDSVSVQSPYTAQKSGAAEKTKNDVIKDGKSISAVTTSKDLLLSANLSDKQIAWLEGGRKAESSNKELSDLIDKAGQYISPKEEHSGMRLDQAQNLAVQDPALFLQNMTAGNVDPDGEKSTDSKNAKGESEAKRSDTKKVEIAVTDLRTILADNKNVTKNVSETTVSQKTKSDNSSNTMQLSLTVPNQPQQTVAFTATNATAASPTFQSMVANQIMNSAGDIVRAGSIVLKDNNVGTINLVLHPESLGNVKISLQLSDKLVTGHIIVHSKEAFQALSQSADTLKQAFMQSGFDASGFDVSFSGQNSGDGYQQRDTGNDGRQFRSMQTYGEYAAEGIVPTSDSGVSSQNSGYSINIVA